MLNEHNFELIYSTGENEPADFFYYALCNSNEFDLGLGFFNSSGFRALSLGFAFFIIRGGKMRMLINNSLSEEDKEAIEKGLITDPKKLIEEELIKDFTKLWQVLSKKDKHFFNCLSWLIAEKRLEITAIIPTKPSGGIAHHKFGIFRDLENNKLAFNGSANFSKSAIVNNVESIDCYTSWSESEDSIKRINHYENIFNNYWEGKSEVVKSFPLNKVKTFIRDNFNVTKLDDIIIEEQELNEDEAKNYRNTELDKNLGKENNVKYTTKNNKPSFPFNSVPRDYQVEAYNNWVANNYTGIFAMATGTGKTITSLNCILEESKKNNNKYNVLILVPTRALVYQWIKESQNFNFKNIHSTQESNWFELLSDYLFGKQFNDDSSIFFIATYQSFVGKKFQRLLKKGGWKDFTLIADETHNMGSSKVMKTLPTQIPRRIGLSATPERIYDDLGSKTLSNYFNSYPPCYTYIYSMYKAIHGEMPSLVEYFYHPYFTSLNDNELEEYKKISDLLLMHYDTKENEFDEEGKRLLIKRKRIINRAENKIETLRNIFDEVKKNERELKYTFVYVPEGYEINYSESSEYSYTDEDFRLINKYNNAIREYGYSTHKLLTNTYNRQNVLRQFSEGKIDILLAMKILDEGVDIPQTKNAIFCASTGNPRQYIQRRGRVLRKSEGKQYANIYDIIIAPRKEFINSLNEELKKMEINILRNELRRVANFLYAAENRHQNLNGELGQLADYYNIDISDLIQGNLNIDENCK